VNVDLGPILAAKIGLAVAALAKEGKALVARDTRVTGLVLENALVSGLLAGGTDVDILDVIPTPVLAYLTRRERADAGVMITASHNPPEYNGIKVFGGDSLAHGEESQDEIERIVRNGNFRLADWRSIGAAMSVDRSDLYAEMIQKAVELRKKWHIVADPGCGATCVLAPSILKSLGCKTTAVNAQPDGFFPARSSEPNSDSLKPLARIAKALDANVGMAYDGDGDRVAFIDEKGSFANFDRILAAYAAHVVKKGNGGTIVTNVEASMCVERIVEAHGGKVVRTKVGDTYVSEAIKEHDAVFGGEPCGAWIHPRFHYCPDGILSSALLLQALEEEEKVLSEFVSEVPQFPTLRENVVCASERKRKVMENIRKELKSAFPKYEEISVVDGVRLTLENGWALIRASGTEPMIRLTVEGESLRIAREIMEKSRSFVRKLVGEKQK
jgi:phosphoglucosamine mutase